MANCNFLLCYLICFTLVSCTRLISCTTDDNREVYIVYLGSTPKDNNISVSRHLSLLNHIMSKSSATSSLLRSYQRSFNGFAAKLDKHEVEKLSNMREVVSIFPSKKVQLQTTRSWDFLGFGNVSDTILGHGSDIIIGVIDGGIWPESDSFNDYGYTPPPKKWKGSCHGGKDFKCNNKIIGAKYYISDSARDEFGHGSHTASTAVGNMVNNTSFYGIANGTARGGLPNGRIAVYKVCAQRDCNDEDILAAFDDAIADGVDIITLSIGTTSPNELFNDPIAIGAFHAMQKGILTVQAAGNQGPTLGLISSVAPWIFSVAASSTDRKIIDKVVLGNGKHIVGKAINGFSLNKTLFPLVIGGNVSESTWGKIVVDETTAGIGSYEPGTIGVIALGILDKASDIQPVPAAILNSTNYEIVKSYAASSKTPLGTILKSETIKDFDAPLVTSFSARGPNKIVSDILKPDISAPGENILAAYVPTIPLLPSYPEDKRRVKYNFMSGTSMACPHVSGAAAYVKTIHPNWSPSAIKSALMTTASTMHSTKDDFGEFAYGSGHLNPLKAIDPGLIYEIHKDDYIHMLCSIGLSDDQIGAISGNNSTCRKDTTKVLPRDLNYPSLAAKVKDDGPFVFDFHRRVTNVGFKNSTYKAEISPKPRFNVNVVPKVLSFGSLQEEKSFTVTVIGGRIPNNTLLSTSLEWSDGTHSVRSPIIIYNI